MVTNSMVTPNFNQNFNLITTHKGNFNGVYQHNKRLTLIVIYFWENFIKY